MDYRDVQPTSFIRLLSNLFGDSAAGEIVLEVLLL